MNNEVKTELGTQEIFSANLKRYVKLSGKMHKDVAKAVGVCKGTFCDWMNGRSYPRMDKVQKLADYFGITKSDLVEKYVEQEEQDQETIEFAQKLQELYSNFHKIPEEKRKFLLTVIQAAIDNL